MNIENKTCRASCCGRRTASTVTTSALRGRYPGAAGSPLTSRRPASDSGTPSDSTTCPSDEVPSKATATGALRRPGRRNSLSSAATITTACAWFISPACPAKTHSHHCRTQEGTHTPAGQPKSGSVQAITGNRVELGIVIEARLWPAGQDGTDRFLRNAKVDIVPVDADLADRAMSGWWRYGKGRHPAGLNFSDCFTYALADRTGHPVLCTGEDFAATDITVVRAGTGRGPRDPLRHGTPVAAFNEAEVAALDRRDFQIVAPRHCPKATGSDRCRKSNPDRKSSRFTPPNSVIRADGI